ncbi:MAG: energy-coupling factor transporter transmembrane component T family protein [Candidatus Eiseniibacteriota bacterium]
MTSDLALVDRWASGGRSLWHRASAISKMAFVAMLLVTILTSHSIAYLGGLYVALCALLLFARIPLGPALLLGLYPVLFSSLFILSNWDGTWQMPALLLLRSLAGSLAAVLLVATTPYPDLFAPISRVTPRLVGDGLFLTYRAFFNLLRRAERMWAALRLRGGLSGRGFPRDLRNAGEGLGTLVLHSFDRSERLYAVMQLRGHSGRVCGCRHWAHFEVVDVWPAALGVLALVVAFAVERGIGS